MPKLIRGDLMSASAQREALSAFVYRWTFENPHRVRIYKCDFCDIREPYQNDKTCVDSQGNKHSHPTIPLVHDSQWLAAHAFAVNKDGRLSKTSKYAKPAFMADEG